MKERFKTAGLLAILGWSSTYVLINFRFPIQDWHCWMIYAGTCGMVLYTVYAEETVTDKIRRIFEVKGISVGNKYPKLVERS